MELSLRVRLWTVLHVVAIVVCYRGKVLSAERAQGCVGSQLSLRCPEMKTIQITAVVLGDTKCLGSSCCIKDNDCTRNANENHKTDVRSRCDNKQSCTVGVLREKIPCGFFSWSNNDFERITYNCVNEPQMSTTTTSLRPVSTENIVYTEENTLERETEKESTTKECNSFSDDTTSPTDEQNTENITDHDGYEVQAVQSDNPRKLPAFIPTVCLLTLIAITIAVAMIRRKRKPKVRPDSAAEIMDIDDSDRNEAINTNENQTMSQSNGNGFPIYSNDAIIKSENKGIRVYENCQEQNKGTRVGLYENLQVQNNAVYNSVEGYAGSRSAEGPLIYADSSEPVYQVPRPISNFYSVVGGEPECAGSTVEASNKGYNVYCNLKTMEPANTSNSSCSKQNGYDETSNRKESEYEAMKADKSILMAQTKKKKADSLSHKTSQDPYIKVNKPSRNVATSEAFDKVASKDKVGTIDGHPNPIYEEMSPAIPESMYANATLLSVSSRVIPTEITAAENPYCEMK